MTTEAIRRASVEIASLLLQGNLSERGVHAETIIGSAAALAGEFALLSAETTLPENGWVLSNNVDGILFENETANQATLWMVIRVAALRAGASESDLPDPIDVVARTSAAIGGSPFPPITVPAKNFPREWSPNACPRFRADVKRIGMQDGLSPQDLAIAIAFAIALLIEKTKDILSPDIAAMLALEIMIGVSRMAPLQEPVPA